MHMAAANQTTSEKDSTGFPLSRRKHTAEVGAPNLISSCRIDDKEPPK